MRRALQVHKVKLVRKDHKGLQDLKVMLALRAHRALKVFREM